MPDVPTLNLPDRGHFGPRVRVEFERDILLAILAAAGPELSRLDAVRINGELDGEALDERIRRAAGVANNDVIRLWANLETLGLT